MSDPKEKPETTQDTPNTDDPDFDPSEFDDEIITYSTGVELWVPQSDDSPELTIKDLIDLSKELETATLQNNTRYISQKRILQSIEPIENTKLSILGLGGDWPSTRLFEQKLNVDGNEIFMGIVNGFSPFSLIITKNGDYEDFWPPFHEEDYFIEIAFENSASFDLDFAYTVSWQSFSVLISDLYLNFGNWSAHAFYWKFSGIRCRY